MNINPGYSPAQQNDPITRDESKPADIVALAAATDSIKTVVSPVDNLISDVSQPLDYLNSELENRHWPEL